MNKLTCSLCGRTSSKTDGWYQIFLRKTDQPGEESYYMCGDCYEICRGEVIDRRKKLMNRSDLDQNDPLRRFIGTPLRGFLMSSLYLQTKCTFEDRRGFPIQDYMPAMPCTILSIFQPDEDGCCTVTVDFEETDQKDKADSAGEEPIWAP